MEVIWRRGALNHLDAIREFIAEDNPNAAARVCGAIEATATSLAEYPHLGRPGRVDGTRELVVVDLPYVIVYRVADEMVRIVAVLHTSRQWPQRF